jgi:hypothetical protein
MGEGFEESSSWEERMVRPSKQELLDRYKSRQPNHFQQIDGYDDIEENEVVQPDEDGHAIFSCETYELMAGSTVRVLVRPDTPKETVIALLDKIRRQYEHENEGLADSVKH